LLGWKTNRRIIVFESDDWGSIRTRSKKDYDSMLRKGLNVDKSFFTKYDSLESNEDLERFFNFLFDFKDSTGRPPVITPMCIVANPNFEKISLAEFQEYHYKTLDHTLRDYPKHDKVLDLWKYGAQNRIFVPALHGREHVNVKRFMEALNDRQNPGLKISFDHQSIGASLWKTNRIKEYLGALHPDSPSEILEIQHIIQDGASIFEKLCGYKPTHFIGPNREPVREVDEILFKNGIKYLTQSKLRKYPKGNNKYGYEFNWLGKTNKFNQTYIMRNSGFEPAGSVNTVDTCLNDISIAFRWNKPAVISTHRANYIGSISKENAENGLRELKKLLNEIIKRWPNSEFMTSTELGQLINEKLNATSSTI
jgi:hypothetical protein